MSGNRKDNGDFKFFAFISYKREDEKYAVWIQNKIERYRLPALLCREKQVPRRLKPICRDKTDLSTGILKKEIEEKLEISNHLIVICSPAACRSRYINEEIDFFASLGRKDRIIPLIVKGTPYSGGESECMPEALRRLFPKTDESSTDQQLLGANINEQGKGGLFMHRERAFIMILSKMLNVSFDSLWDRNRIYLAKLAGSTLVLLMSLAVLIMGIIRSNRPFDAVISIQKDFELPAECTVPPADLVIIMNQDTMHRQVSSADSSAIIKNIHGALTGKSVRILLNVFGFHPVDTVIEMDRRMKLELRREPECFGHIEGIIRNGDDEKVTGATVEIDGIRAVSDSGGRFAIDIPMTAQKCSYSAIVRKDSEEITEQVWPMQHNPLLINTLYLK